MKMNWQITEYHNTGMLLVLYVIFIMNSVKIRVMPTCFLVLARLFLRLEDVLVRTHEARIYHCFGTDYLIREYTERQADYARMKPVSVSSILNCIDLCSFKSIVVCDCDV
jgi:hypothetical protein